jgi:hypothetical protein
MPYLGSGVNAFPYISASAYNLWFWVDGGTPAWIPDTTPLVGSITYFQAGITLFAFITGLLCLRGWLVRIDDGENDYLLWAVVGCSFFMLPTQMHERYLYPGIVFLALGLVRDWRLVVLYVVAAVAFTDNIVDVVTSGNGLLDGFARLVSWQPTTSALLLTGTYLILTAVVLKPLILRRSVTIAAQSEPNSRDMQGGWR